MTTPYTSPTVAAKRAREVPSGQPRAVHVSSMPAAVPCPPDQDASKMVEKSWFVPNNGPRRAKTRSAGTATWTRVLKYDIQIWAPASLAASLKGGSRCPRSIGANTTAMSTPAMDDQVVDIPAGTMSRKCCPQTRPRKPPIRAAGRNSLLARGTNARTSRPRMRKTPRLAPERRSELSALESNSMSSGMGTVL